MERASIAGIVNLTAQADRLRMGERSDAPDALVLDRLSAQIVTADTLHEGGPVAMDVLYVVISGSGTVRVEGDVVEFTAGDLLLVPAGTNHRFADLAYRFKAWRIALDGY